MYLLPCKEKSAELNVAIDLAIHPGSESEMGAYIRSGILMQEAVANRDEHSLSVPPEH